MDHATPNLPSRDFEATSQFYGKLGFSESWRDRGWMILKRGDAALELPGRDLRQQIEAGAAIEERDEHGVPRLRG